MTAPMVVNLDITCERTGTAITGRWHPNPAETLASWEMVVELSTRVTLVPLRDGEGLLDEALASFYNVFTEARSIMRHGGPALAENRPGELSFAVLIGHLLNQLLRPVLSYWHPELEQWSTTRPEGVGAMEHEQAWDRYTDLRTLVDDLRLPLTMFAHAFAEASGAQEYLHIQIDNETRLYEQFRRQRARAGAAGSG